MTLGKEVLSVKQGKELVGDHPLLDSVVEELLNLGQELVSDQPLADSVGEELLNLGKELL